MNSEIRYLENQLGLLQDRRAQLDCNPKGLDEYDLRKEKSAMTRQIRGIEKQIVELSEEYEPEPAMQFDDSQLAAIDTAVDNKVSIITGGAGTGKTTIIKAIADRLGGNVTVLAPTGKAAARLKEATGFYAETIHRCLGWDSKRFQRSLKDPFGNTVIIDEASMVGSWLMARLLEYVPPRLVLVGDAAQLPPVDAGQPFHDLLKCRPDLTATLNFCWRAQGSVHRAAKAIREGAMPLPRDSSGGEDFCLVKISSPGQAVSTLAHWAKSGKYDPFQDVILAAKYGDGKEDGGIDHINKVIHEVVNPASSDRFETEENGKVWRINDRIICNKNFSKDDLWNGDLGTVKDIDVDRNLWVALDRDPEELRLLTKEHRREIKLAYCLSVHKSQGSQFRRVYFVVLKNQWMMLSRSLIYTGVTRAQKGCVVLGDMGAFRQGINQIKHKRTILQHLAMMEAIEND